MESNNTTTEITATSPRHWWELIKADHAKYEANAHPEDRMGLVDYASECGSCYGYKMTFNSWGEIELV